jgi:hypothetical protein
MKKKTSEICKALKDNCWHQGSCLYLTKNDDLIKNKVFNKHGLYIVITQSCDLLHPELDDDPYVELVYAKEITKENGNFTAGRNPREIHIPIKTSNGNKYYKCHIKDKIIIQKKYLLKILTSSKYILEKNTKESLIKWVIKRYNRMAFPDTFNNRINDKTRNKIKKIIKNHTSDIHHGIFINLSSYEELNENMPYEIEIYILAEPSIKDERLGLLKNDAQKIENYINSCNGIMVDTCMALKLDEIDAYRYLELGSCDFEYLSF